MRLGTRVRHPKFGEGQVVTVTHRGGKPGAQVDFGYMKDWVSFDELELTEEAGPLAGITPDGPTPVFDRSGVPTLTNDVVDARRAILALKLGQVLERNIVELSTGTDDIQESLKQTITAAAQRQPRSILFKGSYGSGKTHLLTMLTALAAKQELATTSVILDGEGVTLTEPMSLMEALLGSIRYPGEAAPCGITQQLADLRIRRTGAHPYIRRRMRRIAEAIFQTPRDLFETPEGIEVLEEYFTLRLSATQAREEIRQRIYRRVHLPSMRAQSVKDRADRFCDLLGDWAEFCASTGAKGLVMIFDEVDVEYASTLRDSRQDKEQRSRRSMFLCSISKLLKERKAPLLLAFGSAPASPDVKDENDAVIDLQRRIDGMDEIEAPQPQLEQTRELGRRLQTLYARAYPDRMDSVDPRKLERLIDEFAQYHQDELNPIPRSFVRGTLERLDVALDLESYKKDG